METPPRSRLYLSNEVLIELTRRAAKGGNHANGPIGTGQTNTWAQYALLLALVSSVLDQAPQSQQECAELDIEDQVGKAIAQIVEVLHALLPNGIMEIISYLPPEKRNKGWGRGVRW
jgi:hypothetical protein